MAGRIGVGMRGGGVPPPRRAGTTTMKANRGCLQRSAQRKQVGKGCVRNAGVRRAMEITRTGWAPAASAGPVADKDAVGRWRRGGPAAAAAAAGGAGGLGGDPYALLGVKPGDSDDEVRAAVRRKLSKAKGDDQLEAKINDAYDKILLSAFNSRLSGQTSVKKEIKYADRGWNIPWKPRKEPASEMDVKINALVSVALAGTTVMRLMSGLEPSVVATMFFIFRLYRKLDPYYTVESEFEDDAPQKTAKLLRAIGVVFGFLAVGICAGGLAYTCVNVFTQMTGMQVPMWTMTRPTMFVNLGSIAAAFATTFYR